MGRTKNKLPWTVWRRVSRKAASWCWAVSRDSLERSRGDGQDKHPSDHQVQIGGILHGGHPRPVVQVGAEPGVDGQVDGCTQVDTITGPIRAKARRIPSVRKGEVGVYRKPICFKEGHLHQGLEQPAAR